MKPSQEHIDQAISDAYDYIVRASEKQLRLLPLDILYGDGTRFLPLTKKGFEVVYQWALYAMRNKPK